jgi:2-iminobutanoate/2-iminopropanoate deaminase
MGPYSQATALSLGDREIFFLAGQIPLDPGSGELVQGAIEDQVDRVMLNLAAVLDACDSDFSRVLKTTIFLRTMDDFAAVNGVYARYMGESRPARATVAVAGLPLGVDVEIEMVAYR